MMKSEDKNWMDKIDWNDERGFMNNPISPNLWVNRGICPRCKHPTLEDKGKVEYNSDILFQCKNCKKTWILSDLDSWLDEIFESNKCSLCERYTPLYKLKDELCPDCQEFLKKYNKYKSKIENLLQKIEGKK